MGILTKSQGPFHAETARHILVNFHFAWEIVNSHLFSWFFFVLMSQSFFLEDNNKIFRKIISEKSLT